MCSGRVDLEFILRAFQNGQDAVFIGGCRLGECNYVTHGNFDALANTHIGKKLLARIGVNPERLRIDFMSGGDGLLLAEYLNDFSQKARAFGPIGKAEGLDAAALRSGLEAARRLVPYIRLVERERLRVPVKSGQAYDSFFTGRHFDALFNELIADKLTIGRITLLLGEKPRSTGEISEVLGLNPSEASRYLNSSARQGLVRYDTEQNRYALA